MTRIIWDDSPGGNIEHIEEHGLTIEDVEHVIQFSKGSGVSATTGWPCAFGYTSAGTYIIVVFQQVDTDTVCPITAYEVPEP